MDALISSLEEEMQSEYSEKPTASLEPESTLRLIVQRCDRASLEIGKPAKEASIQRGLVTYIGFDQGCDESVAKRAAKRLVRLRILSLLEWKDDTIKKSIIELLNEKKKVGILVVPQVSLSNRISSTTNRLTAAKACSPEIAEKLYKTFVDEIKSEIGKHGDIAAAQQANLKEKIARIQTGPVDPKEMFKIDDWAGQFSEYDDKGIPTHDNDGKKLSKGRAKKYTKLYKKQCIKYEKWISEGNRPGKKAAKSIGGRSIQENKLFTLVCGDFGERQALRFEDTKTIDCGPNTTFLTF